MSFINCIRNSHEQGLITLEQRQDYEKRFEALQKLVPTTREAKERLLQELEGAALEKERRAVLAEKARKEIIGYITKHRNRRGEQDIAEGLGKLMDELEPMRKATLSAWMRGMDGVLEEFKKGAITGDLRRLGGKLGNEDVTKLLENVVRELFGVSSKDPLAKALADAVGHAFESARTEFNALGGNIPKLKNYGMPQSHQADRLFHAGIEPWVEFIMPLLDREKTVSPLTGKPMSDADMRESLRVIWGRITSDGFIDMDPSMTTMGKGALFNQHQDHRFLHFKDPDSWMKYAKEFGNPDFYATMVSHLEMMARDVTAARMFGPNPVAMLNYTTQFVRKHITSARTLDAIRSDQMAELKALFAKRHEIMAGGRTQGAAPVIDRVDALHNNLNDVLAQIDALRRNGDIRRNADDAQKMQLLHQEMTRINIELGKARSDPFYDVRELLPMSQEIELADVNRRYLQLLDETRLDAINLSYAARERGKRQVDTAMKMWDMYRGTANAVHDYRLSNAATALRNVNAGSKLGGAMMSAFADVNFQKITRLFLGMERSGFGGIIKGMTEVTGQLQRAEAVRMDIISDTALNTLNQSARMAGAMNTTMWSGYLADRAIGITGLPAYTEMQKRAFGMEFFAHMADNASKPFRALPDEMRRMMLRRNFSEADWNAARMAPLYKPHPDSAPFLRPVDIEATAGKEVALKYSAMMFHERTYAIIEPTLRARTMMTQGIQKGTWAGEMLRSGTQFKSFPVTVMLLHGGRLLDEIAAGRKATVAQYAVGLLITGVLIGGVVIQLKDLIAGRDPRPIDNAAFWGQALLQSGGLGIYGDFIQASGNRFGGGLASTLAGPTIGQLEQVGNLTIGNIKEFAQGKNTNFGSELTKFVQSNTPFASTFYARKAADALLWDNLQRALDKNASEAFERRIKTRDRDYNGQQHWWAPGETAPRRAPDVTAITGRR